MPLWESHPFFKARIEGGIAHIALSKGLEAIVDVADLPLIQKHCWHALTNKSGHAYAAGKMDGKATMMHRHLMQPKATEHVDHIDGNGLNNRRSNMRICTHAENMKNRTKYRRNSSGFTGVEKVRSRLKHLLDTKEKAYTGKYKAYIRDKGRTVHLGTYATAEEAAAAYRGASKALWGEFAPE